MILWGGDYKRVQRWHRYHNSHHIEYSITHGFESVDVDAMIIDNECSRYTKAASPYTARQWFGRMVTDKTTSEYDKAFIKKYVIPRLNELKI